MVCIVIFLSFLFGFVFMFPINLSLVLDLSFIPLGILDILISCFKLWNFTIKLHIPCTISYLDLCSSNPWCKDYLSFILITSRIKSKKGVFICAEVGLSSSNIGAFSYCLSMYYQYPFPIRKLVILNFQAWKLFLSSFSTTIWLTFLFDIFSAKQTLHNTPIYNIRKSSTT